MLTLLIAGNENLKKRRAGISSPNGRAEEKMCFRDASGPHLRRRDVVLGLIIGPVTVAATLDAGQPREGEASRRAGFGGSDGASPSRDHARSFKAANARGAHGRDGRNCRSGFPA